MKRILLFLIVLTSLTLQAQVKGAYVTYNDELYYEIQNCNQMQPFFISLASDDDLWMYVASTGSLTCGRQNPDFALFPYVTDDVILSTSELTGPKTIIQVDGLFKKQVWEPFSDRQAGQYAITRSIAKSVTGNRLRFSETNNDLHLRFTYEWCATNENGWIRHAWLTNLHKHTQQVQVLDGVQNVVPAGIDRYTNINLPTLVDAYKRTERVASTPLFLFTMEATLVDRPEPSESLTANTAYFQFVTQPDNHFSDVEYLTATNQLDTFRCGRKVHSQPLSRGVRGAALVSFKASLSDQAKSPSEISWYLVMNTHQNSAQVHNLMAELQTAKLGTIPRQLEVNMDHATATLHDIVAQNDGVQLSADTAANARHFANTLFNTMRGGFYCNTYTIDMEAFAHHVQIFNRPLYSQYETFFRTLPSEMTYEALGETILKMQPSASQAQLYRLYLEYLPITFSRRHGDPSRPWNLFNVRVNDANGKRIISYQGNWRDIFQNWEALSVSYPDFVNSIIAKFLNATTRDGYNPYRVTSEGIDWEKINPADPWSNIGYWGDHQIIYLQKLLELAYEHNPQMLYSFLNTSYFTFANVPYRIKGYDAIVADPKATIVFDDSLDVDIQALVQQYGADAKLIGQADTLGHFDPMMVTFTEKILVTYLTKLSNFIPEAGIWMNTLRPEWNDANNALVGNGASMVTLYYMRRMVAFLQQLYAAAPTQDYAVSAELYQFFASMNEAMNELANESNPLTDARRRYYADLLGRAGEQYRNSVYQPVDNQPTTISSKQLMAFLRQSQACLDASIAANHRADGLYEAYNLVAFTDKGVQIEHLYEMLEGQVAVLSSGALTGEQVLDVLKAMRRSALYREDQRSYTLYPFKQLPSFITKNTFSLPNTTALQSAVDAGILLRDKKGMYHFSGECNNAKRMAEVVAQYNRSAKHPVSDAMLDQLTDLYEQTFHHHAFTGRSGTMYKYEGLGSIYWHMVSKLKLAVAENIALCASSSTRSALIAAYREIDEGIGSHKQPQEYGSFPFDAYSHTPSMSGVQQPGMTGQVKEDIISRFIELGIRVQDGQIFIDPCMLTPDMFLDGKLTFTYCGTRFIYTLAPTSSNLHLDAVISRHIFARDGQVPMVQVNIAL